MKTLIQTLLDPMVMTHGRRFLQEPENLQRLIEKDGLEKVSIHVDATQRGRERLQARTFRVPVEGRMIPMCELNATGLRSKLYPAARLRKVVGES